VPTPLFSINFHSVFCSEKTSETTQIEEAKKPSQRALHPAGKSDMPTHISQHPTEAPQEKAMHIETPIASHSATPLPIHPSLQASSGFSSLTSTQDPNPGLLLAINNLSAALNSSTSTIHPAITQLSADLSSFHSETTHSASQFLNTVLAASQDIRTLCNNLEPMIPILGCVNSNFELAVNALTNIKELYLDAFALQLSGRIANNFNQAISEYFSSLTREKTPSSEREKQSQTQLKNMVYLIKSAAGQINDAMKNAVKAGDAGKSANKPWLVLLIIH
jgi:hypothetical protein